MKVLELLDELDEIMQVATTVPISRKVVVDPNEITEIVKEIRLELPDEIQQAQWIKSERQRILDEAKAEYEKIINEAQEKAAKLVEEDELTLRAKERAEEILGVARDNSTVMKMSILNYTDSMLYNLQEKVDQLYATYFTDMYNELQGTFDKINTNISTSRKEVKDQLYLSQNQDGENKSN